MTWAMPAYDTHINDEAARTDPKPQAIWLCTNINTKLEALADVRTGYGSL